MRNVWAISGLHVKLSVGVIDIKRVQLSLALASCLAGLTCANGTPANTVNKHAPYVYAPQDEKAKLGKLGMTTAKCVIHAKASAKSQVFYKLKQNEYIVVLPHNRAWVKVLLQNGAYGFIESPKVQIMPYVVTGGKSPGAGYKLTNPGAPAHISEHAMSFVGQYVTSKIRGGGFVSKVFTDSGVPLPVALEKQSEEGVPVPTLEKLVPGDRLYFWSNSKDRMDFAGIYLGNGYFVAPLPGHDTISTEYLGQKKWLDRLVAGRH